MEVRTNLSRINAAKTSELAITLILLRSHVLQLNQSRKSTEVSWKSKTDTHRVETNSSCICIFIYDKISIKFKNIQS